MYKHLVAQIRSNDIQIWIQILDTDESLIQKDSILLGNMDCVKLTFENTDTEKTLHSCKLFTIKKDKTPWSESELLYGSTDMKGGAPDPTTTYSIVFCRHCPACHNFVSQHKRRGFKGRLSNCLDIVTQPIIAKGAIQSLLTNVVDCESIEGVILCSSPSFRIRGY